MVELLLGLILLVLIGLGVVFALMFKEIKFLVNFLFFEYMEIKEHFIVGHDHE